MSDFLTAKQRDELLAAGWTARVRYIDKQEGGKILGFRLTNCEALFERALSIQIFDRSKVSLSFGFSNDQHVSLTEEDGREFLEWMYKRRPEHLPANLWEKIPEPDSAEAREAGAPVIDLGKVRLVDYLVQHHPDIFGKFATTQYAGGEFFDEVLALIKDPARDDELRSRVIYGLEFIAHMIYTDVNAVLRTPETRDAPKIAINAGELEARALIRAAERLRAMALEHRGYLQMAAPPAFPDAITDSMIGQPAEPGPVPLELDTDPFPHTGQDTNPSTLQPGMKVYPDIGRPLTPGELVAIMRLNDPRVRQIGEVVSTAPPGTPVQIKLPSGELVAYSREDLLPLQ